MKELTSDLAMGEAEFHRLTNYIREYQEKSTHKVSSREVFVLSALYSVIVLLSCRLLL